MPAPDSVPLEAFTDPPRKKSGGGFSFKSLAALFLIFVLVVSDVFSDNVLSGFRGAVRCRAPSSFGVVLQGVFLVIFYVLAVNLIDGGLV